MHLNAVSLDVQIYTTLRMSVATRRTNWSAITNTYAHIHTTEGSENGKSEEMRAIRKANRRKEEGNPI